MRGYSTSGKMVRFSAFGALLFALVAGVFLLAGLFFAGERAEAQAEPRFKALVFSKTTAFRHDSIPVGVAAIQEMGEQNDFQVDATEDAGVFTEDNLAQYDVVIFLSTDGNDVLSGPQKVAFERYIQAGGGWAGVHAAANTETNWAWYGDMLGGAYFQNHPGGAMQFQDATVRIEDSTHPSTQGLPAEWVRNDEWYNFRANPRDEVHVLANLDENTYEEEDGSAEADDHPIAWCSPYDGGRSWYTGMGHASEHFSEPNFRSHLLGGIEWAAGAAAGDCGDEREGVPSDSSFEKVALDDNTENPIELDVSPDGRVFYVELAGKLKIYKPETRSIVTAADIPVGRNQENGLLGVALDPEFPTQPWVYLFYSAPDVEEQRISRFTLNGDTLDLSSERILLRIPHQREYCCHSAGSLDFGPDGSLFASTGDDTIHYESSGYSPHDERTKASPNGNPDAVHAGDARRTSGNSNDLRGKILRIHPEDDGTYTIPEGNLFPESADAGDQTKPEIYTMGHRNPFRITVDQETGWVYNGEVGPDANSDNPNRGPRGYDEFNQIRSAGNYGWPFCMADNRAYNDYDFATGTSGPKFDCAGGPTVDPDGSATYLDGLDQVPAARPAWLYYPYGSSPEFPDIPEGPGRTAGAAAVYHYNGANPAETKFPEFYDDTVFISDWSRDWISTVRLDEQGEPAEIDRFMPNTDFRHVEDMAIGEDGSMYVLEWGKDFNYAGSGVNPDSGLYRIDYAKGARSPIARASSDKNSGPTPLEVQFSSEGSRDPDGDAITFEWDFDGDGTTDSTEANPLHTYSDPGSYQIRLTVTDETGKAATSTLNVAAGNTRPEVTLEFPEQGGFFGFGDQIPYKVTVNDAEDGTGEAIDCTRVTVQPGLFHDEGGNAHVHPGAAKTGCEGVIQVESESGHDASSKISEVFSASYEDEGGQVGSPTLDGTDSAYLNPKVIQAEHYTEANPGTRINNVPAAGGGKRVGYNDAGEWISFEPMNFKNIDAVTYRYTSGGNGGYVDIRTGSPDGPVISTAKLPNSGGWDSYADVRVPITDPGGTYRMYFTYRALEDTPGNDLFDLDQFTFHGKGVSDNAAPTADAAADPVQGVAPLAVNFTGSGEDPDGDALTYKWDFGVSGTTDDTSTEQNPAFTYQQPGAYTARLTVTDAAGRSATDEVTIRALQGEATCLDSGSDQFDGAALDESLWTVVDEDASGYSVGDGSLNVTGARADIHGNDGTTLPNIVVQPAPGGAWTATVRMNWRPTENYQNAGLMLYGDNANFMKAGMVHANGRAFEFFKETGNTPANQGNVSLPADFPDDFYLRFVSDGTSVTAQYSRDGATFEKIGGPTPISGIADPKVGVYATNSTQNTTAQPTAKFDWFALDKADEGPGPDDEFDGAALDRCRWTVENEDPGRYTVSDGSLNVTPPVGQDMFADQGTQANVVVQPMPEGAWTATAKMNWRPTQRYQNAGLVVYGDEANFLKTGMVFGGSRAFEFFKETGNNAQFQGNVAPSADFPDDFYLRYAYDGSQVRAQFSADGETFTDIGNPVDLTGISNPRIGIYATNSKNAEATTPPTARFDWFHVDDGSNEPPEVDASANKTTGEAPLQVAFSANATDPDAQSGDQLTYSWDFGDGSPASTEQNPSHTYTDAGAYTATVTVTDPDGAEGSDSVEVTAEDGGPQDTEAPDTQITSGPRGSERSSSAKFRFTSTEEGSTFECSLDGSGFSECSSPEEYKDLEEGRHVFRVRAVDASANQDASPAKRIWKVDTIKPKIENQRPESGSRLSDRTPMIGAVVHDEGTNITKSDIRLYVDGKRITSGFTYDREKDRLRWSPEKKMDYAYHSIEIVVTDEAGNRAAESWRFKVVRR